MAATSSYHDLLVLIRNFNRSASELQNIAWSKLLKTPRSSWCPFKTACLETICIISGNDSASFLSDILPHDIDRQLPHGEAIQALAPCYNDLPGLSRRPMLIALKQSPLGLTELRDCGFCIKEEKNYLAEKHGKNQRDTHSKNWKKGRFGA